ncbi:MAG TPA: HAMP domain-containing sensor histidine kinase [Candidatus Pacearchaeota archaeon]|nr:HAMP domain-containing sensor histidine kinase [Candidatus Pacearchaeota archaeon]
MNVIFNVIFPLFQGTIQYWQFGNYSAIFLLCFTAYAIVKRRLFDIRVALTSIVVAAIAILLVLEFFLLTESLGMRVLKGITLMVFLLLSFLLFKTMNKEAKQKDELMHLAEHLERANRELKKLDHTKSEFLSIASHQLRTPLTAMRGYLSMLIQGDFGPLSPKVKEVSQEVYQASLRLLKLANDLLNVSQIESGKITLVYEKTSIEKLAKSVIDELKIEADKKGLYLKMIIAEDLPEIEIDSEKIRQVLLNIIDNAIKYTKKGGVTVKIGLSGSDHVLIKVQDTGVGMTKEDIGKLFRSFSRGKAGTSLHSSGAGLGLYAARKFVDQHKGRLWVKSPGRNQGSTFFIELPIKQG